MDRHAGIPNEYSPVAPPWVVERRGDPVYAIGYADGKGGLGMAYGPVFIVYFAFQNKGYEKLYRWHRGRQAWLRIRK